jgi:hypothetical protein
MIKSLKISLADCRASFEQAKTGLCVAVPALVIIMSLGDLFLKF